MKWTCGDFWRKDNITNGELKEHLEKCKFCKGMLADGFSVAGLANHMRHPVMCCVCGFPANACTLTRLTWDGKEWPECQIVVNKSYPKNNDVRICVRCIREIKRLPFSDLTEEIAIPF